MERGKWKDLEEPLTRKENGSRNVRSKESDEAYQINT